MSVWFIKLGIRVERIEPGKPQQNGRHARMHLTLKREAATSPRFSAAARQRAFDAFRKQYDFERPHEALGMRTPASIYVPSSHRFPEKLSHSDDPWCVERALVDKHGFINWQGRRIKVGLALKHELVELRPRGRRKWHVGFGPVAAGTWRATSRSCAPSAGWGLRAIQFSSQVAELRRRLLQAVPHGSCCC